MNNTYVDGNELKLTPSSIGATKFETKLDGSIASVLNSYGQCSLGNNGLDPWYNLAKVMDVGSIAMWWVGPGKNYIGANVYQSGASTFKFKESGYATMVEYVNLPSVADEIHYRSTASGIVDGTITWVKVMQQGLNGNLRIPTGSTFDADL